MGKLSAIAAIGVQTPFRIQKLINGGLALDISLTNAVVNSGLQDTEFPAQ